MESDTNGPIRAWRLRYAMKRAPALTFNCLLVVPSLSLLANAASGAGFGLTEFSAKGMGTAYAGTTAGLDEAATVYWNPAGMTRLEGIHIETGVAFIDYQARFRNQGSTQTLLTNPGPPASFISVASNGRDDTASGTAAVPNAYLTLPLNDRMAFGIGVSAPFGLETDYAADWVGRYHAIKTSLTSVNVNPSFAYRIDECWSVGVGVSAQYVDATLSRALFTGGADGLVTLEGTDWAYGFNLGLLFAPNDWTRVGVAYRSPTNHEIEGTRTLSGLGPPFDGKVDANVPLHLPPNLALGFRHRLGTRLALMGDVTWTGWSAFDELRISFSDGSPDDVTVADWNDSWRFALGLEYDLFASWTLRGGFMYDQTPIPAPEQRTPRIPDSDRTWAALGATWRPSAQLWVDLAYGHLFFDEADVRSTIDLAPVIAPGAFTDTLVGEYENTSNTLAVELRYRF